MKSYNGFEPAQRYRALGWLRRQYAAGTRTEPTVCDACGQQHGILERHSEDYSEPFGDHIGAYGLCYVCHMMVHCRFNSPQAWQDYKSAVNNGVTFPASHGRNFMVITGLYLARKFPMPQQQGPAPERRVLDEIDSGAGLRRTR